MIAIADTLDVASRNLRTMLRMPQALIFALIQPVLFVLMFRYAFGGAIHVPGIPYVDYLIPGVFAQSAAFGALGTAVGLSTDLRSGLLERFRTLPMSRSAVLAGRTIADLARSLAVVAVMAGIGFAVGFRVQTSALAFLAGLGLVALFGYALSWGCVSLGLRISDPEAAQAAGVPATFLLVFCSGGLQVVAAHQPLTAVVDAVRALTLGGPTASHVLTSLAWSGGLLVVFAALAISQYQRMSR
jgi:ABC-2 type transport system permease protein/oleandomycin transport system permease protein